MRSEPRSDSGTTEGRDPVQVLASGTKSRSSFQRESVIRKPERSNHPKAAANQHLERRLGEGVHGHHPGGPGSYGLEESEAESDRELLDRCAGRIGGYEPGEEGMHIVLTFIEVSPEMGMAVDQARQDEPTAAVDDLVPGFFGLVIDDVQDGTGTDGDILPQRSPLGI